MTRLTSRALRRSDAGLAPPTFIAFIERLRDWAPEPRVDQRVRPVLKIVAWALMVTCGILLGATASNLPPDLPDAAMYLWMAPLVPAALSLLVLARLSTPATRSRLARSLQWLPTVILWLTWTIGVACAGIGSVLVASTGHPELATQLGLGNAPAAVPLWFGMTFAYFSAIFLFGAVGLRGSSLSSTLMRRAGSTWIPVSGAVLAAVCYATGIAAAVWSRGPSTLGLVLTIILFCAGACGQFVRLEVQKGRDAHATLLGAVDGVLLNSERWDAVRSGTHALSLSRAINLRAAFGMRVLPASVRTAFDAVISHLTGVPLPHRRPFDVLNGGEFRDLHDQDAHTLLIEGCVLVRAQLTAL